MPEQHVETVTEATQLQEQAFMRNLFKERDRRGMTQGAFATYLRGRGVSGMHQTTLSRLESGSRPLKLREAIQIAAALEMPLAHLLTPPSHVEAINAIFDLAEGLDDCVKVMADELRRARSLLNVGDAAMERLQTVERELTLDDESSLWLKHTRSKLAAYLFGGEDNLLAQVVAEASVPPLPQDDESALIAGPRRGEGFDQGVNQAIHQHE